MYDQPVARRRGEPDRAASEHAGSVTVTDTADGVDGAGTIEDAVPDSPSFVRLRSPGLELRAGDVLGGRYELQAALGQGGMGAVFRARDRVADEIVAIKLLLTREAPGPKLRERFRRELRAARKIMHPGVVRLHDLLEIGDQLALSMEYVEGEDLAHRLARGPRPTQQELSELSVDLARALAAAHKVGVVHRDIKPANVILRKATGRAVITDFGVSRLGAAAEPEGPGGAPAPDADASLTREGDVLGTPLYMAPEQLQGRLDVGPAADVYAFGLLLYEAATGAVPHRSRQLSALVLARSRQAVPPLGTLRPELDPTLCGAIDRCLRVSPSERFASGVELRAALSPDVTNPGLAVADPLAMRRSSRARRVAVALGASAAITASALGWWWWRGRLPESDRRVALVVRNRGDPGDEWLAPAIRRLGERRLGRSERRFAVAPDLQHANVEVRIDYRRTADRVTLTAGYGPPGRAAGRLEPVEARSVAVALDRVLDRLGDRLGQGQPERGSSALEQAEMVALGTASPEALRAYERGVEVYFGTTMADSVELKKHLREAIRLDPGWAHPHALLATGEWEGSPEWTATMSGAERHADPARDLVGQSVLQAIRAFPTADLERARVGLAAHLARRSGDVLLGWTQAELLVRQHHVAERIEVLRHLHAARPDLQFGADLARALADTGRDAESSQILEQWLSAAPDNEQAWAARIARELREGKLADAERHARALMLLHGEAPQRLAMLCDVLLSASHHEEAAEIAGALLQGDNLSRAWGRRRLGEIALAQGRFKDAHEALRSAAEAARTFTVEGELPLALESLRVVAAHLGMTAEARGYTAELARLFASAGDVATATVLRAELLPCEELRASKLPDPAAREAVTRGITRLAASRGCRPCRDALARGRSPDEPMVVSRFRLALCAESERDLALSRALLEDLVRIRTPTSGDSSGLPSIYHAILARFHLGRVLERSGDAAGARLEYAAFLAHWGSTDVPEAAEARRAVSALGAKR